ncbi:Starch synthase [Musa troglodytarum]|uniref:starch synthase n=1 Tax=Musa troglodytarum TaxID=320322 RepID=A0A9E7JJ82_9LILI|nr:Starch synthase [Musa troglodytarum]
MSLQPQRPICCRRAVPEHTRFRIRPVHGLFSHSTLGFREVIRIATTPCMLASSGYSNRRPRRTLIPGTKASTRKGFAPRPQVGTSTQKKDQNDAQEEEVSGGSGSKKPAISSSGTTDRKVTGDVQSAEIDPTSRMSSNLVKRRTGILEEVEQQGQGNDEIDQQIFTDMPSDSTDDAETDGQIADVGNEGDGLGLRYKNIAVDHSNKGIGKETMIDQFSKAGIGKEITTEQFSKVGVGKDTATDQVNDVGIGKETMTDEFSDAEIGEETMTDQLNEAGIGEGTIADQFNEAGIVEETMAGQFSEAGIGEGTMADQFSEAGIVEKTTADQFSEVGKQMVYVKNQIGRITIAEMTEIAGEEEKKLAVDESRLDISDVAEPAEAHGSTENAVLNMEESLLKQKADMEAKAQRQLLENLADENFSEGIKVFVVPQVVNPDQVIEIFFNRSLSALANEPDVLIKGAYNGWRWKFFTEKLQKTDLKGDWWSCQLSVPTEAYKVDFVFFNGANAYENNNSKDFSLPVEGGMDETAFEDLLLEEKHKEIEKLAAEQAEKERQAEEQRRKEAEKAASEADKAQAKVETEKQRHRLHHLMKLSSESASDIWQIEPNFFKGGDRVRLYYNRSSRPLSHATEIWIHGGHNSWSEGLSIIEKLSHSGKRDGDWWSADVVVPDRAMVLDWVFADGPPGKAVVYDNNNRQDFHATVPKGMPEELFWVEEEHRIYRKLQEERRAKEEAVHKKAEKTARMKAETKERTMKMFLLSQKHIVYTEPIDVRAGSVITVLYNPSNTVLNGKPEVWFRCSFNRWSHHNGPLPPQKMVPAENASHLKATGEEVDSNKIEEQMGVYELGGGGDEITDDVNFGNLDLDLCGQPDPDPIADYNFMLVKVPMDVYMMDFVFSEREDGGIYDNRNGMDYHIPVIGGIAKEPPMHIVHIAVEMAPIAKVGGLGDVVTSLSRAVQDLGHTVDIVLPKYNCMNLSNVKDLHFRNSFAWDGTEINVWFGKVEGLPVYFLEPRNGMFSVGCIYGRNDDGHRFGFFCHAALEFLLQSGFQPDILHCHDWSSAPVAWLFKEHYAHYGLSNARVIFTIHNLEFGVNNITRAMAYADKATTVSQTYSREVAGNPAICSHLHKFHGIVNGIDPDIWDPYNDHFIPVPYTPENVVEGKKAAKEALQQRLGLRRSDHPLIGIITRLTVQKGIHLIKHAVWQTLERNGQVVLLGSAPDSRIQNDFAHFADQLHSAHAGRVRFCLTYDEPLSHLIYAGADFILVPSLFEPCGLTQLIAMRYGSIPVVRRTGGLYDTVFDVDNDKERARAQGLEPNGFSFEGADPSGVDYALNRHVS